MNKPDNGNPHNSKFQQFGLMLAGLFYMVACVMVYINTGGSSVINPKLKTISFAHWQLEDGFREGYDEAIKNFVAMKKAQGEEVKIVQTTVPMRGYRQWFMTQLISGNPADVIELLCSSDTMNQYFTPLSQYISKPNPFNTGTPFEGVPWKDTYVDGMDGALDPTYSEYFGIGSYFHVYRLYVNMELLEKSTGSRKLPKTLTEWMDTCQKMREYGKKIGKPIIPIGVRGFDKSTIRMLFDYYYKQMNGNLTDGDIPIYVTESIRSTSIWNGIANKKVNKERLLAAVNIIKEVGQNFGEGFTATDLEQTKFLFFTGNVGFFPEGTWNAFSMVNNSPFDVGIAPIPIIGAKNKYYKYFTGVPGEQGSSNGGKFGIPKASRNFNLAMEFLQYISSWKVNQKIMIDYCKWPSPVKKSEYKGIMKHFEPMPGNGNLNTDLPFWSGAATGSHREAINTLEDIIIKNTENCEKYYWNMFLGLHDQMESELSEAYTNSIRKYFTMEALRGSIQILSMNSSAVGKKIIDAREKMIFESVIFNMRCIDENEISRNALKEIEKQQGEGE